MIEISRLSANISTPVITKLTLEQAVDSMRSGVWTSGNRFPNITFGGALYKDRSSRQVLCKSYSGLVVVSVPFASTKQAETLRRRASLLPQTMLAYVDDEMLLRVILPFVLPDGRLPSEEQQIELFHAEAYRRAALLVQPQLDAEIISVEPSPFIVLPLAHDPQVYYCAEALPIRLEQPDHFATGEDLQPAKPTIYANAAHAAYPSVSEQTAMALLYRNCFEAAGQRFNWSCSHDDLVHFFVLLAENCLHSGIPEEEAVGFTLHFSNLASEELLLRTTFRDVYRMGKDFGRRPTLNVEMSLHARQEEFMQRRYQFRLNSVRGTVEYRKRHALDFAFLPLYKRRINGITLDARAEGLDLWDRDVARYIESDRISEFDPIRTYLDGLCAWNGQDHIRAFADRVPCANPRWRDLFYRWFLAMVAQWTSKDEKQYANCTVPLLVGSQGTAKSTFCRLILPAQLADYYTDHVSFSNEQSVYLALTQYALVNMDEFDSISSSYQPFLKHVLQKPEVKGKRPYGKVVEKMRRLASFIATSNSFDLLTDSTGSRRYICIEVLDHIDVLSHVPHSQMYAQAMAAIRAGERTWFDDEETAYIQASNAEFCVVSYEESVVFDYFRAPNFGEAFEELTCTEMLERIKKRVSGFKYTKTMVSKLGKVLRGKFKERRTMNRRMYQVVEIQ